MTRFVEIYISCLIMWTFNYLIGRKLLEHNQKDNMFKIMFCIGIFSLLLSIINVYYSNNIHEIIKFVLSYLLICIFFKIIFNKKISDILVVSLLIDLMIFIAEVVLAIIFMPISYLLGHESLEFLQKTVIINFLNSVLLYLIFTIWKTKFIGLIKNNKFTNVSSIIIILFLLVTISLLFIRIPISNWNFNSEFIITMIILFCSCILGLFLIKQKSDIHKTTSRYQQLVKYSDVTNGLLEDYRIIAHEHKNQLLIIRSMIDENNKEAIDYLDNLLDKRSAIKYVWIEQLNHLSLAGLKGLINYKLMEMESLGIKTNIYISSQISKTKLDKLSTKQKDALYSIIGVYLDNAIQAAKDSKENEISLEIYKEQKDIVIVLANTYKDKIDLEKIDDYGYTTKGKNHGIGLHIVKKILDEETVFSQNRKLFQEFYVQELRIHLDKMEQKKKKQK